MNNIHEIVEKKLGTYEFDGIEWDCYGDIVDEGPVLIQIALHGSPIDLFDLLNDNHINSMQAQVERAYLDGQREETKADQPFTAQPWEHTTQLFEQVSRALFVNQAH